MMTTIANISLIVAALLGLCVMLRWDLHALQQSSYNNSRYNTWLRQNSDLASPKRLIVLAVLIGSFTTMAQTSWMVVLLLAIVLAALAIAVALKLHDKPLKWDGRVTRRFILALILALLAIAGTMVMAQRLNEADALRPASMLAVLILAISPLLTMLSNWLLRPLEKHHEKDVGNGPEEQ